MNLDDNPIFPSSRLYLCIYDHPAYLPRVLLRSTGDEGRPVVHYYVHYHAKRWSEPKCSLRLALPNWYIVPATQFNPF